MRRAAAVALIAWLLAITGCSTWRAPEQRAFAFSVACRSYDMVQTDWALEHGYRETNPLLGDHPSDNKLMAYTAGTLGATYLFADRFKTSEDRVIAILLATAPCVYAVVHNHQEGVRP